MSRFFALIFAAFTLAACASGDWPTGKDLDAYDHPVVEKRYKAASKTTLGTPQDIREIKVLIRKEGGVLDDIRWRSLDEVMLYVTFNPNMPQGLVDYYYVLRKIDGRWRIIQRYLDIIA